MVQIMGKIGPIYVPYFAHGVLHSKFLKDFNSHSRTGSDFGFIQKFACLNFNSHSHTKSDKSIHTKSRYLLRNLFLFSYPINAF